MGLANLIIGFGLAACAGICASLGIARGGAALVLLWPAASMSVLAFGYLHAGPGVMGKCDDGHRRWWATVLHAPSLLVQSLVWMLGQRLRPEPAWNQIAPGIHIGRWVAGAHDLPPGIRLVVDLTAEYVEPRDIVEHCDYRSLPTLDGTSLTTARYASILAEASRCAGPVYIHCAIGHGRSAMFAAGMLIERGLAGNVEECLAIMKRHRPRVHLRSGHKRLVAAIAHGETTT